MQSYLEKLGVSSKEYAEEGLFVLRSTVMNPFYYAAREVGKDYLYEFLKQLHIAARRTIGNLQAEQSEMERRVLDGTARGMP